MTSVLPTIHLPPNPLAAAHPVDAIDNVRDVLALLSALNIGSDLINARACSGYWFVLQAADQSLAHVEALLEQERVACRAEHREVAP